MNYVAPSLTHQLSRALAPLPRFFFNDTATPEIYTLSLHDALPISIASQPGSTPRAGRSHGRIVSPARRCGSDRKSTRLNSSHTVISYAVFCLKKKKNKLELAFETIGHGGERARGFLLSAYQIEVDA